MVNREPERGEWLEAIGLKRPEDASSDSLLRMRIAEAGAGQGKKTQHLAIDICLEDYR
jgi:hypothetical protein